MNAIELAAARAKAVAELAILDAEIADLSKAARAGQIAEIKLLMASHGLTHADFAASRAPKGDNPARAPMYRNGTGQTWAGRGKRPDWLRDALTAGRPLEAFRIAQ